MARHKRQHDIHAAYLEGFSASDLPEKWRSTPAIWVLRKGTGRIRLQSIKNTAVRNCYYSYRDKRAEMNPLTEKWFNARRNLNVEFFPLDGSVVLRFAEPGDQIRLVKHRDMARFGDLNHLVGLAADAEVCCASPGVLRAIGETIGPRTTLS